VATFQTVSFVVCVIHALNRRILRRMPWRFAPGITRILHLCELRNFGTERISNRNKKEHGKQPLLPDPFVYFDVHILF
jgi:hypothetical protein